MNKISLFNSPLYWWLVRLPGQRSWNGRSESFFSRRVFEEQRLPCFFNALHGVVYKHLDHHGSSKALTFSALDSCWLKSKTEEFIMAVQNIGCRACHQAPGPKRICYQQAVYLISASIHQHNGGFRVFYYNLRHSLCTRIFAHELRINEQVWVYWNYWGYIQTVLSDLWF